MNKSEIKDKLGSVFSWLKEFGGDSVRPAALLWLLDFKAVQQGVDIATAFTKGGFNAARKVASEIITRVVLMAFITASLGVMTYWLGDNSFVGKFFLVIFSICLIGVQLYIASVALAAAAAWQILRKEDLIPKEGLKPLDEMWELTKHVLYWDCIFILINLAFQPWQPGRFEWFVVLFLSEAAWFLLGVKTRKAVRLASAIVAGFTGIIAFVGLLYLVGSSVKATEDMTRKMGTAGVKAGETFLIGFDKLASWGHNRIEMISVLSAPDRIIDANQDGKVDSIDVGVIQSYAKFYQEDTTRVMWVTIGERKYPIGDHDGDGVVEVEDADDLRRYLAGEGPGPADMKARKSFSLRTSTKKQNSKAQTQARNSESRRGIKPRRVDVNLFSPEAHTFFDLNVRAVEITSDEIRCYVSWLRNHARREAASVSSRTYLETNEGDILPIKRIENAGVMKIDVLGKELSRYQPFEATLIFNLPKHRREIRLLNLYLYDLDQWGHCFSVKNIKV